MSIRTRVYGGDSRTQPIVQVKGEAKEKVGGLSGVTIRRDESRRSNARASDRHRLVDQSVRLTLRGRELEGELINLSGGGAMIAGSFGQLKLWDRIDLNLGDHGIVECAVRWIRRDRVGLEFAHETQIHCSDEQLATVLRETISRSFPQVSSGNSDCAPAVENVSTRSGNTRSASRHSLIWWAVLHYDFGSTKVRVRNISPKGAMLEYDGVARVGAEPLLEFSSGASVPGTIAWTVGDQLGLSFHSEFDMEVLATSGPHITPNEWAPPAYLNKTERDSSAWDPHWNRLSVEQLQHELGGFLKY